MPKALISFGSDGQSKGLSLRSPKLHIRSMAAKAKKGVRLAKAKKSVRLARAAGRGKQPAMELGYIVRGRGAAKRVQLTAADFDRTVIYRGIKIEPMMAVGKRSPLARAIRNELRIKSEQVRGKSG